MNLKDELISHVDNPSDIKNRKQISACVHRIGYEYSNSQQPEMNWQLIRSRGSGRDCTDTSNCNDTVFDVAGLASISQYLSL